MAREPHRDPMHGTAQRRTPHTIRFPSRRLAGLVVATLIEYMRVSRVAHADRPFDGTDAVVADCDEIEFEIGLVDGDRVQGTTTYTPELQINYGFLPNFELVVDVGGTLPLGDAGGRMWLSSDVLVKHVFRAGSLQGHSGPSLAVQTGALLPDLPVHGHDATGGYRADTRDTRGRAGFHFKAGLTERPAEKDSRGARPVASG